MSAYTALWGARFRTLLQYRAAAWAGFGTQLFWGLIRVMIFTAFYHSTTVKQPIPLPDLITYLWLVQAMLMMTMANVDQDVRAMICDGSVAYEMLRPLDLYALWYSRALAARVAPTLLRATPLFVVACLFLGMRLPASPAAALAWLVATLGAALLTAAFSCLITVSLLYTLAGDGMVRIAPAITYAFSGSLVPIALLPAWAQPVVNALPFSGMMDRPFRLYIGQAAPAQLGAIVAHQLLWTAALVLFGRGLLLRATRRLVVQGG